MNKSFLEALENRRTYYSISNETTISDNEIVKILEQILYHTPSTFNSQSTRLVLLLGEQHKALWEITKETLKRMVTPEQFVKTEAKIDNSFLAGYGTILFYEDLEVVEGLQKQLPSYSEKFAQWSDHTNAMHQLGVWCLLSEAGLGASLQHYNPLIDTQVAEKWGISPKWRLIAEMPFGKPIAHPGEKTHEPMEKRLLIFK